MALAPITAAPLPTSKALLVARVAAIVVCIGLMYSPALSNLAILVTFLATLCLPDLRERWHTAISRPVGWLAVLFVGLALLWCLVGEARDWKHTAAEFWSWRKLPWFFLVLMLFDDDAWKRKLSVWFVLGAVPGVLLSFLGVTGLLPLEADRLLRNTGTQGVSFSVAAVVCFWWLLQPGLTQRQRWLWTLGFTAFAANVMSVSVARSAYLGIVVSLLVVGAFQMSRRQWALLIVALAIGVPTVFYASDRMQDRVMLGVNEWRTAEVSKEAGSLGLRYIFYKHSLAIIEKHWLIGSGTGSFSSAYVAHVKAMNYPPDNWRNIATDDPHNQFVHIWIDQGLLGLVVFIAWMVAVVVQRRSAARYRALAAAMVLAWSAASLFNGHFRSFAEGHLLATFAGAMVAGNIRRPTISPQMTSVRT
jgi:O-antigen ligase